MQVLVKNNNLDDYGKTFKVRRMNYDQIVVNYTSGMGLKSFLFEDVDCISENEIDDFLINNRDFLKIKLKKGISVVFYNALYDALKSEIGDEIKNLTILRDKYTVNKRGIWDKEIVMTVNNRYPLEVICSGQNFKKDGYNIIINKIEKEFFISLCNDEISKIKREIEWKNGSISNFEEAIEHVKNSVDVS